MQVGTKLRNLWISGVPTNLVESRFRQRIDHPANSGSVYCTTAHLAWLAARKQRSFSCCVCTHLSGDPTGNLEFRMRADISFREDRIVCFRNDRARLIDQEGPEGRITGVSSQSRELNCAAQMRFID